MGTRFKKDRRSAYETEASKNLEAQKPMTMRGQAVPNHLQHRKVFLPELVLCASSHSQRSISRNSLSPLCTLGKANAQRYCHCLRSTINTFSSLSQDRSYKSGWKHPPSILWVKRNYLRGARTVAFTIQMFAIGIKIWGLKGEPQCVHISYVNHRATELKLESPEKCEDM